MARSEALPDIPTLADFVPGYEASSWSGVGAPKGMRGYGCRNFLVYCESVCATLSGSQQSIVRLTHHSLSS
jgi:Tripartite tricarboxylate transporter family receptor